MWWEHIIGVTNHYYRQGEVMTYKVHKQPLSAYRILLSLSLYTILAFGFPLWIVLESGNPQFNLASLASLIIVELAAVRLGFLALKGEIEPLLLTFWIFVAFWMGFAAFAQTLSNQFYWPGTYSVAFQATGVLVIFFGLVSYECGRLLSRGIRLPTIIVDSHLTPKRISYFSLLAFLLAIYGIYEIGGLSAIVTTRGAASVHFFGSGDFSKSKILILLTIIRVPSYVALLFAWYYWVNRRTLLNSRGRTFLIGGIVVSLLVLNMITNFPLALARYWLGAIVLSMVFISFRKTRNTMMHWIAFFFLILLIAFPITSTFRYAHDISDITRVLNISAPIKHLYNGDYDAYQQVLNTMRVADRDGFSYGRNFLGAALFWVPRSRWHNKPFGTGATVADELGYSFTNLSDPLWAESYYAFGFFGVIFVFLLYGYISGKFDHAYKTHVDRSSSLVVFVVPFWMAFQIFFLRGDLMNGVAYGLPVLALIWLVVHKRIINRRHVVNRVAFQRHLL